MSAPGTLRSARPDPLLEGTPLPIRATLYPVGFQVDLATNSHHVLEAAKESWGDCRAEFACEPLTLRVIVRPEGEMAQEPVYRSQAPLFAVVADRDNFATFDAASYSGFCMVSAATAAQHTWFRWCFLEGIVYMMLSQRYIVPVHAACVTRGGRGVLLCGRSGAGKSTLAYACAKAGWTYLCDDATLLLPGAGDRWATGRPRQIRFREDAPALFPELSSHAVSVRPRGKLAIEVPTAALPGIRTASHCTIGQVVFLERQAGARPRMRPLEGAAAVEWLLADLPSYADDVNALHESTVRQLECVPAWRMSYEALDDAVALVSELELS